MLRVYVSKVQRSSELLRAGCTGCKSSSVPDLPAVRAPPCRMYRHGLKFGHSFRCDKLIPVCQSLLLNVLGGGPMSNSRWHLFWDTFALYFLFSRLKHDNTTIFVAFSNLLVKTEAHEILLAIVGLQPHAIPWDNAPTTDKPINSPLRTSAYNTAGRSLLCFSWPRYYPIY